MSKYFYKWSPNGTVIYVKKFYVNRGLFGIQFTAEKTVYTLYTRYFDNVLAEALRMIKIYESQDK